MSESGQLSSYLNPRHLWEEQLKQVILSRILRSDCLPIAERRTYHVDCSNRIGSRPNEGVVVIRRVPLFLKLDEGVRYVLHLNARRSLPGAVECLDVILADALHLSVVERPGEHASLA